VDRAERLVDLFASLLAEKRPVTFAEIRGWFPASYGALDQAAALRKFQRDRRALHDLGISVRSTRDTDEGDEAYFIDRRATELPDIALSRDELAATQLAGASILVQNAFPYHDGLERALEKIALVASGVNASDAKAVLRNIVAHHPAIDDGDTLASSLHTIEEALADRRPLGISYRRRGAPSHEPRVVEPYGLACRQGRWYLVARDRDRDAIRVFAVHRITGAEKFCNEARFEIPQNFELRRFVNLKPWAFLRHAPITVILDADPEFSWMVARDLEATPAGLSPSRTWTRFSIEVTNEDALVGWILSMGPRVRVDAPMHVRDRVIRALQTMEAAA
jgi:predicted DNA-binding transcriptional regulator YafY